MKLKFHAAKPDRKKECCRFDRNSSQYVRIGNALATLFERTSAFSIALWMKCPPVIGTVKQEMVSKTDPGASFIGFDWSVIVSGRLTVRIDNVLFTNGRLKEWGGDMRDNRWHHVVLTQSTSGALADLRAYVDGVENTTVTNSVFAGAGGAPTTVTTAPLQISGDAGGLYYTGKLDEVGIYNKTLSAAEVSAIYGAGTVVDLAAVGPTANLVGYWRMGEGASYPVIPDASGGGNPATMHGMARADITIRGA